MPPIQATYDGRCLSGTYDTADDVLHVQHADRGFGDRTVVTDEGHALSYDRRGSLVGLLVANAAWALKHGELAATRDGQSLLAADELARIVRACLDTL